MCGVTVARSELRRFFSDHFKSNEISEMSYNYSVSVVIVFLSFLGKCKNEHHVSVLLRTSQLMGRSKFSAIELKSRIGCFQVDCCAQH